MVIKVSDPRLPLNSAGGLLLFDVTKQKSFKHIAQCHQEVVEKVKPFTGMLTVVVVGH